MASDANWEPPVQAFCDWLKKDRVTGSQDDHEELQDFVPSGEVAAYLKGNGVLKDILAALYPSQDHRDSAKEIVNRFSKVFAILISIGYGGQILNFLPHDSLSDGRLPFETRPLKFPRDPYETDHYGPGSFFGRFQAEQPRFCAQIMAAGAFSSIEPQQRMPFLEKTLVGRGGSAHVFRIKVHADHDQLKRRNAQPNAKKGHSFYALKTYTGPDSQKNFKAETRAFRKLHRTGLEETHMVGFYCCYVHRGIHHAVFEFADMGTLEDYMKKRQNPSTSAEILAFWDSMLHMIEALGEIHDMDADDENAAVQPFRRKRNQCVHQDIKMENILVKRKEGPCGIYSCSIGLADLGTSSLHTVQSTGNYRDNFGTKTYGAPECFRADGFEDNRDIPITPKVDIWSFLTVLSEVCIWVVFGYESPYGVEGYRDRRRQHNQDVPRGSITFHRNGEESQAVADEHKRVADEGKCDPTTRGLLHLMPQALRIDPEERPSAKKLRTDLMRILDEGKKKPSPTAQQAYVTPRTTHPRPRQSSSETSSPLQHSLNQGLAKSVRKRTQSSTSTKQVVPGAPQVSSPRAMTLEEGEGLSAADHSAVLNGVSEALQGKFAQSPSTLQHQSHPVEFGGALPIGPTRNTLDYPNVSSPHSSPLSSTQHGIQDLGRSTIESERNISSAASTPMASCNGPPSAQFDHSSAPNEKTTVPQNDPKPPVNLSFAQAINLKRYLKNGGSQEGYTNGHLLSQLEGRDHIFVVDDSQTMHELREGDRRAGGPEVADYVGVLSYLVKWKDPDGVDLHFFNSNEKIIKCRHSTRLETSVRRKIFDGISNPDVRLGNILVEYSKQLKDNGNRKSRFSIVGAPKSLNPLSIYVLTDGVWESAKTAGGVYLRAALTQLIRTIQAGDYQHNQVGIQFIRFGDNPHGVERLQNLDNPSTAESLGLDIIDTEPVKNGNVWKMLLGAINPRFDADRTNDT